MQIERMLAREFSLPEAQLRGAVKLLDEGKTVPFIARYRKEATCPIARSGARARPSRGKGVSSRWPRRC